METQTQGSSFFSVKYMLVGAVMLILSGVLGGIVAIILYSAPQGPSVTQEYIPQISSTPSNIGIVADDVRILFGTITAIKGNSFTLRTQTSLPGDPLADRKVTVMSKTKFVKILTKDKSAFLAEREEYNKKIQEAGKKDQLILPPEIFIHENVPASELRIGDRAIVTASENIATRKEFTASEIQFNSPENVVIN